MKLLDYAKKIEPCQRNWDETYVVPDEHIDYITEVCTTVPTKQNRNVYSLIVVTDRDIINKIFEVSYEPTLKYTTYKKNSQVLSNALFIWIEGQEKGEHADDLDIAVGISSGAAALAGAELGYSTGFCKCFIDGPLRKILKRSIGVRAKKIVLMLGIGIPNKDYNTRQVVIDNRITAIKYSRGKKDIKIFKR